MMIQQSSEWFELRKNKIGASDANVIMGVSPFKTPYQLWAEKLELIPGKKSPLMKWGLENEQMMRQQFFDLTKIAVVPQVMFHVEHEWLMASLDGVSADGKTTLEIKCHKATSEFDLFKEKKSDFEYVKCYKKVPHKYYPQVQVQLEVTGLDRMFYMCFCNGDFQLIEVEKDEKYIAEMIPKLKEFWDMLQSRTAPSLTEKDKKLRNDARWNDLSHRWACVQEQKKSVLEHEKALHDEIMEACNGENSQGCGLLVYKIMRKGRIQYNKIEALQDINLDDYRSESKEIWTIRTKEIDD